MEYILEYTMLLEILNECFKSNELDLLMLFDTHPDLFLHIINNGNLLYSRFLSFLNEKKKIINIPQFLLLKRFPRKNNVNKMVCIEGTVIKTNPIMIKDVNHKMFCFRCNIYGEELKLFSKKIQKNTKQGICSICKEKMKLKRSFEKAVQTQSLKIQDISLGLSEICEIRLPSFLVGKIKPGQKISCFGVVLIEEKNDEKLFVRIFLDVLIILEKKSEIIGHKIKEKGFERQKLLLNNFCKEIYGYECIKLGLMLSIFGVSINTFNKLNPNKKKYEIINEDDFDISDSEIYELNNNLSFNKLEREIITNKIEKDKINKDIKRKNSHILIIGTSSSGKTKLLKSSYFISKMESLDISNNRNAVFINGLNTSEAGLTTCAVRSGKDWTLEAGALVLADGGTCFIDGFEYLNLSDKSGLLEVMEQQTLSIAKAGLVTTLTTRCSIVASNLINSIEDLRHLSINYSKYEYNEKYDQNELISRIKISPPLFSRFDLVFLLPDTINKESINHILNYNYKQSIDTKNIFDYIEYKEDSKLTEEGINYLTAYYTLLISNDINYIRNQNKCISTIRLLEGMIRLLISHCTLMGTDNTDFNTFSIIFLMEMSVRGSRGILNINSNVFIDELIFINEVNKMKEILIPIIKLL